MKRSSLYFDVNKLTDGELADLLHELNNELDERVRRLSGSWLQMQLNSVQLRIRSYGTIRQNWTE